MKTIIFTLATGMLSSIAFSQDYHKLIRTDTYWDSYYTVLPQICYSGAKRDFFINRDTIINGLTYKISRSQEIQPVNPGPFCPPFVIDTAAFTGAFLREDTLSKRVYINSALTNGTDVLLYDFSLHTGDTLQSSYLGMGESVVIDTVMDVLLNNGETRKTFFIRSVLYSSYTEGIGCSLGLYAQVPVSFCECTGGYFCVQENTVSLLGDQCNYPYLGQGEMTGSPVAVYPNPARDVVNVFVPPDLAGSEFVLLSLMGEQVQRNRLSSLSNSVSVSNATPGTYFYQVKSERVIHSGKLTIL
jgi:hypothetical protein